jgi:predicted alpha-1,2-mannosidase
LQVKVALSSVSEQGAIRNMESEIPAWDFNSVRLKNTAAWENYLQRLEFDGSKEEKVNVYTALYHLLLQPSNIADVDGQYRGADDKVMKAKGGEYYSTLSNWDIYRAAFPLLQLIVPERIDGIIQTLLAHHKAKGFLPIWTVWGQDNYCMIGNHSIPMIVSAYANGFRKFDAKEASQAMVETSTRSHIHSDWETYQNYGYYPFDKVETESVSRTLESCVDDWAVAYMAQLLHEDSLHAFFDRRSRNYVALFDSVSRFFRGKNSLGQWRSPFDPCMATSPMNNPGDYTEANAWQYLWTTTQSDPEGFIELIGGRRKMEEKLDSFFNTHSASENKYLGQEAMIGQYAHANEPDHHVAFLYGLTDHPEKSLALIQRICKDFYKNKPDGLIGNDDCGQMSAWYLFALIGMHPLNPMNGQMLLSKPLLKNIRIQTSKNTVLYIDTITDKTRGGKQRTWNGVSLGSYVEMKQMMKGGTLKFIN